MRFGKILRIKTISEWRFYSVDYKKLKQVLNGKSVIDEIEISLVTCIPTCDSGTSSSNGRQQVNHDDFFSIIKESEETLRRFYEDRENWAVQYLETLKERVEQLRQTASNPPSPSSCDSGDTYSMEDCFEISDVEEEKKEDCFEDDYSFVKKRPTHVRRNSEWLKEQYRRFAKSQHFHTFIYAKKSLSTFLRELNLLLEFLELNTTALSKILKKYDKVTSSNVREEYMSGLMERNEYLRGDTLRDMKCQVKGMIDETERLKPTLPEGWEERKVYTIGCFDLFHRGHQNVLMSLREFGYFVVAGIHDDESYFKLKNKYPIDDLETRMHNVKPFVDQLFVIPSTDPLIYIKSMVSEQDIETGRCCYARGDDMLHFPGREWVESVMPVHFVPRTEACSSTLIRTIYHEADETLRSQVAFAKTRYDGKPIDENGNVIDISSSCPSITVDVTKLQA